MDPELQNEVVSLTKELIRIPSENPTGTENQMADRVEDYLLRMGLDVERDPVCDGRENVTAELGDPAKGPTLVLLNHMDTVPAGEDWTRDPFGGEESGGKIWGRGACDMKGGLAAGLVAVKALKEKIDKGARVAGAVRSCIVVDEEGPWMRGAAAAVERGRVHSGDVVISCEPTRLRLITAQKAVMWYEAVFFGKSAHGAAPHMGADAIQAAAHTVIQLQEKVKAMEDSHPLLGRPTLVTSVIAAGRKTNVVADRCRMEIDFRFVPPLALSGAKDFIEEAAARACARVPGTRAVVKNLSVDRPPVISEPEGEGARRIREAVINVTGGEPESGGVGYYTDAGLVAVRTGNKQSYVFGPGNIENAHAPDEFIEVAELQAAARILASLVEGFALE